MDKNSDGVMGRHGDGEQEIILLPVPESPFPRVVFVLAQKPNIPIFQYSSIPGWEEGYA